MVEFNYKAFKNAREMKVLNNLEKNEKNKDIYEKYEGLVDLVEKESQNSLEKLKKRLHQMMLSELKIRQLEILTLGENEIIAKQKSDKELHIVHLGLTSRVYNSLVRSKITTISDLLEALGKGDDTLMAIRGLGETSLDQIMDALKNHGYL